VFKTKSTKKLEKSKTCTFLVTRFQNFGFFEMRWVALKTHFDTSQPVEIQCTSNESKTRIKMAKNGKNRPNLLPNQVLYQAELRSDTLIGSTGGYYGLIQKGGKPFRQSLKTWDRKLAELRFKRGEGQNRGMADEWRG
jgi:hypothetical protein